MVKGEVDSLVKTSSRGRCSTHGGTVGMLAWVDRRLNPLADSRRTSTASDQESLSVQSWSMPGSGWRPDSNVHSISDDDLVGKVVGTVSI